jgi:amino acid transporter
MIVGMVIGSGIFTAPVIILGYVGSVGMTLVVFLFGSLVAICGTAGYVELGCIRPVSGGEREYLDFAFPKMKGSISFCFTQSMVIFFWIK